MTATEPKKEERQHVDYATLSVVNITFRRPAKWYMFIAKQALKYHEQIDIRARPSAAAQVVRVAEALKRLGYVTYVKYKTETIPKDNRLQRFIVVTIKKTANFDKLYEAREEERKKKLEEAEKKK